MLMAIDPLSTVDDPNGCAIVLYTDGCNLRCPYCHNRDLVLGKVEPRPFDYIMYTLRQRRKIIDRVVICGGEPTVSNIDHLKTQIREIRELNYKIKFDTNGILYGNLRSIIMENLVDYVALDMKTNFDNYMSLTQPFVVGMPQDSIKDNLISSLQFLVRSIESNRIQDFELRTTCVNPFVTYDSMKLAIDDVRSVIPEDFKIPHWYLQSARISDEVMNPKYPMKALSDEEIEDIRVLLSESSISKHVAIR